MVKHAKNEDRPQGLSCDDPGSHLSAYGFDDLATLLEGASAFDEFIQIPMATELERPSESVKDRLMSRIKDGQATAA